MVSAASLVFSSEPAFSFFEIWIHRDCYKFPSSNSLLLNSCWTLSFLIPEIQTLTSLCLHIGLLSVLLTDAWWAISLNRLKHLFNRNLFGVDLCSWVHCSDASFRKWDYMFFLTFLSSCPFPSLHHLPIHTSELAHFTNPMCSPLQFLNISK